MKVARTTVLEMEVLTYLEREYLEFRERLTRKRAEMVGKLQDMGYGEPFVLSCTLSQHVLLMLCTRLAAATRVVNGEGSTMFHTGPDDIPLHDWGIPPDKRLWLMEKQRHLYLKEQIQQLYAELTDRPLAPPPPEPAEGVLDVAEHQTSMQSCRPATATIASRLSARVVQLA